MTSSVPNESAFPEKPLAVNVCCQRRSVDRGFPPHDRGATLLLRSLHPPAGRLSFRIRQTRADRGGGVAVHRQNTGVAGVHPRRWGMVDNGSPVHLAVQTNVWCWPRAPSTIRADGRIAVLF